MSVVWSPPSLVGSTQADCLPADWTVATLADIGRVYSGGTPSRARPSYWGPSIPWVTTKEVDAAEIRFTLEQITEEGLANSAAKIAPPGTLLIAMYGQGKTRGKAAILGIAAAMNQACAAIELRDASSRFVFHYLVANYERIRALSNAGSQENLSGEIVKAISIPIPPRAEQDQVACVLDDTDQLISTLELLIAKKQRIRQGLAKGLFAGRIRLPVRTKEWRVVQVGSVTTWLSGGTPDRSNVSYWGGAIPWISAASLKATYVHDSVHRVTEAGLKAGTRLAPVGSTLILVRGMALHRGVRIGLAARDVSFNQDVKALVPRAGLLPEFLVYALQARSSQIRDLVSSAGSGTGVLDTGLLKRLLIPLPGTDEQRLIVTALGDADREIDVLRARLGKAHAIKQGMAQELLTGRVRLPVAQVVA
jgi:type I restriction enzyme S subunit